MVWDERRLPAQAASRKIDETADAIRTERALHDKDIVRGYCETRHRAKSGMANDAPLLVSRRRGSFNFVLHRRATKWSPVKCDIMRARSRGVNFPRSMARFSSYDACKLLTPAMIARIKAQFHLPAERTAVQSDWQALSRRHWACCQ